MPDEAIVEAPAGQSAEPVQQVEPQNETGNDLIFLNEDPELSKSLQAAFKVPGATIDIEKAKKQGAEDHPAIEKAKEEKIETPPKETKEPKIDDDAPPPDPKDIKPPEKVGERSMQGWKALHTNYEKLHKYTKGKETEVRKLKEMLAEKGNNTSQETQKLQQEIEQLKGYRAMFDAQADPEFQSKYEKPIAAITEEIEGILRDAGVSNEVIKTLDLTNSKVVDTVALELEKHVDSIKSKRFLAKSERLLELSNDRKKSLEENKAKYKEFQKKREDQTFAQRAEEQGRISKHIASIQAAKDKDGKDMFPFLVKQEPPVGANDAIIARVDAHNRMVDMMTAQLDKVMSIQKPEEKAEVAVAAIMSAYLQTQMKIKDEKIASLEKELSKISTVGRERGGGDPPPKEYKADAEMNAAQALEAAFPGRR